MPWEHIGSLDSGDMISDGTEWLTLSYEMAVKYLNFFVGDKAPTGCKIGIMWHEHHYGSYPSVGIYWEAPADDAPWELISLCEELLQIFDSNISWYKFTPSSIEEIIEAYEEETEV